jgi:citrate lyase subunit beta/citryl-CoA lyase
MRVSRSFLFVPGNRPERYAKACATGADEVIIDLEDAVPESEKDAARAALATWVSAERRVLVRVNAVDTRWFDDDLAVCGSPGIGGVVLPKAERADVIARVAEHLGPDGRVVPLIETARGLWDALSIAQAPRVQRLAFGSIDFQVDLGIRGDADELLPFRSQLVLVSRLANLQPPIDGVTTALDNDAQLRAEALRARRQGFGGKLCIHPKQVTLVNAAFAPTGEELDWARRVLAAAAAAKGAAVALDGKMIDRPVILAAEEIVREAEAAERVEEPRNPQPSSD